MFRCGLNQCHFSCSDAEFFHSCSLVGLFRFNERTIQTCFHSNVLSQTSAKLTSIQDPLSSIGHIESRIHSTDKWIPQVQTEDRDHLVEDQWTNHTDEYAGMEGEELKTITMFDVRKRTDHYRHGKTSPGRNQCVDEYGADTVPPFVCETIVLNIESGQKWFYCHREIFFTWWNPSNDWRVTLRVPCRCSSDRRCSLHLYLCMWRNISIGDSVTGGESVDIPQCFCIRLVDRSEKSIVRWDSRWVRVDWYWRRASLAAISVHANRNERQLDLERRKEFNWRYSKAFFSMNADDTE